MINDMRQGFRLLATSAAEFIISCLPLLTTIQEPSDTKCELAGDNESSFKTFVKSQGLKRTRLLCCGLRIRSWHNSLGILSSNTHSMWCISYFAPWCLFPLGYNMIEVRGFVCFITES
ncbi:hypothetical protein CDAR_493211 [Caerostris darwini]|uniref:Uncharacterized protein n=1 Tax=Caerostris darwini TaxID=1538125 RepID=A0AAV4TS05_9ARAC|nr:hypothetical protein CDAR_493211 [Caerostris darwini]